MELYATGTPLDKVEIDSHGLDFEGVRQSLRERQLNASFFPSKYQGRTYTGLEEPPSFLPMRDDAAMGPQPTYAEAYARFKTLASR